MRVGLFLLTGLLVAASASAQTAIDLRPGESVTVQAIAAASPTDAPTPPAERPPIFGRPEPPVPTATSTPIMPAANHVLIYDMSQPVSTEAIENPNVDGGLIKLPWAAAEPRPGAYNWGPIDNFIAPITKAGKKFELAFPAGSYVAPWIYDDPPVASFNFIWDAPWVYPICSTQKIPIPWDTAFIEKYSRFVDAVAYRYGANPALSRIKLGGINFTTDEFMLPHSDGTESIGGGRCTANNDVANWNKVGYSQGLVLETFNVLARKTIEAFPGKPADAMIVKFGFPGDTNPAPGQTANAIIAACGEIPGCVMQNNGWKPGSIPIPGMLAYQEGAPHGAQLPQGIDLALAQNPIPHVLEIDDGDINLPGNQAALAKAHNTTVK